MLRDIESLSGAGVPVYAVRGRQGGFELLDGFDPDLGGVGWSPGSGGSRRIAVRVSDEGRRRAAVIGRHLRLRKVAKWDPRPGREDWREATMLVDSLEDARLFLLQLGAEVEAVTPPELRTVMGETAQQLVRLYDE